MLALTRTHTERIRLTIASWLAKTGITPNQLTTLAIVFAIPAAYFLYMATLANALPINFFYAGIFILIAAGIDTLDGALAQVTHRKTLFGNYYDAVVDKIVEIILFTGLVIAFPLPTFLVIGLSLLVSYTKARVGLVIITDNHDWPSLGERGDRLMLLTVGVFIAFLIPVLYGTPTLLLFLYLIIAATLIGSGQRILYAYQLIQKAEQEGNILPYLKK